MTCFGILLKSTREQSKTVNIIINSKISFMGFDLTFGIQGQGSNQCFLNNSLTFHRVDFELLTLMPHVKLKL